jgi:predicted transcriptional regulator
MSMAQAAQKIEDEGVSHLMVTEGDDLVGVICVCNLDAADRNAAVSVCMSTSPTTIGIETTAVDAAELMLARGVSCLPVVVEGELRGVITLRDLRRAGIVDPSTERCSACGSDDHVRCAWHGQYVGFCLECTRKSEPPDSDEDLGGSS